MLREDEEKELRNLEKLRQKSFQKEGEIMSFQSNPIRKKLLEFNKEKGFKVRDLFR